MAHRRKDTGQALEVPPWVREFDPADWLDKADVETVEFADLAATWGEARARQIRAQARWSDACRRWADEHGVTLKEARAGHRPVVVER